ncbi:hypothetical protein HG535_0H03340 [Zygotorulaspora mrakii]|uniref:non-specific serine/threonine protein kinase n=1 Tax=Zygotorulaspora mrakii TaxID=42260 RepID=A0A7H9B8R7_ZYGMR|nr:uncharacterized protein HG535_0H03340 [Zygotorulaspora mrakii]QLG75007.1 hypothetical protein HG535_0H03340 [Zygotorulaspora mrakii]
MTGSRLRPLLPTDERNIASQLEKRNGEVGGPKTRKEKNDPLGPAIRSASNWSLADIYSGRPETLHKALTDTDNFIEMYNSENRQKSSGRIPELNEDMHGSSDDDQITLEEETSALAQQPNQEYHSGYEDDNSQVNGEKGEVEDDVEDEEEGENSDSGLEYEMALDPELKKRREEWAERGAAKIVQEVTNPATGKKIKRVMKKGIKDFKFGENLGDGSYSTVILATSKDSGKKYALKILNKEYLIRQKKVKYVNIEKNALQRLNNSRGIVKLFFTFQDESSLYFLLEYAPNGDFLSVIKKFGSLNEECASYYSAQVIDAIDFIHSKGIIHRDIKPENILLDKDMKVKLTDFGTAKILKSKEGTTESFDLLTRAKSFVGTAEYVSPELLNDSYVDYRCDIWAFGCILFQMIAGKPPFKATNEYLTFQKVMKVQYAFTAGFPLVIRDLVKKILMKQPDQRLSIPQIKKHYFFEGKNFNDASIWSDAPPEIQPYKVSAKSMQPVPALSSSSVSQLKRPLITKTNTKSTTSIASSRTPEPISGSNSKKNTISSNLPVTSTSKKALDERTAQILNNARKAVGSRKQSQPYRTSGGGAASAASAALTKKGKSPPPQATRTTSAANLSDTPSSKPRASTSTSRTTTLIGLSANNSSGSINGTTGSRKTSESFTAAYSSAGTTSNLPSSSDRNDIPPLPSMSRIDIMWSYYLKNIDERVLAADEIYLAVLETESFEKRVQRVHGSLVEPQGNGTSRGTLLSQVARGGGGVTGFRNDSSNKILPEKMYYEEMLLDNEKITKDYRKPGGESAPAHNNGASSPSSGSNETADENGNFALTDKFKKLFQHTTRTDNISIPVPPNEYFKRMLLITSLGRCLIFVKKTKCIPDTNLNYELVYDINLCQSGIKVREIIWPSAETSSERSFTIQTPYSSFVFKSDKQTMDNWLNAINRGIQINHERVVAKLKREDEQNSSALKAARMASPKLARGGNQFDASITSDSTIIAQQQTPTFPSPSLHSRSGTLPGKKHASSTTGTTSATAKGSRIFEHFVNSKEKSRKHASPVPIATKLVNGLPSNSTQSSIGLGISDLDVSGTTSLSFSKSSKKTISDGTSRLLSRSEISFRPRQ